MNRLAPLLLALPLTLQAATIEPWTLPAPPDSAQPNLSAAPDGDLLLSWIERRVGGGHRLVFARHDASEGWGRARKIAEGTDWFINWADFPALQALDDGSFWAHTLVKNGEATYAYDVRLHASFDGGRTWAPQGAVHDDGTPTEHGFASLWPQPGGGLGIAWLDGRYTGGGSGGHDAHAGPMTLRAAAFAAAGKREEHELDARVCDCCQTDSARAGAAVLLAYRDRRDGEVRDIAVARLDADGWRLPVRVHDDGWVMPACPVNGPAIAARGEQAWVAWYTGAGGEPSLRLARSGDGGRRFGPPRELQRGEAVQGRVDVAADESGVWVSWLQEEDGAQSLWLARFAPGLEAEHWRTRVADIRGRGRATGFPRLQLRDGAAWLAWTEVVDGKPGLRGAVVRP